VFDFFSGETLNKKMRGKISLLVSSKEEEEEQQQQQQ